MTYPQTHPLKMNGQHKFSTNVETEFNFEAEKDKVHHLNHLTMLMFARNVVKSQSYLSFFINISQCDRLLCAVNQSGTLGVGRVKKKKS